MKLAPRVRIGLAQNGSFVVLAVIVLTFTLLNLRFFSVGNFQVIAVSMAEVGMLAIVFALLVMSGGIDLSVGSVASAGAVVSGLVMVNTGSAAIGLLAGLGVGLLAGLLNGTLIALFGLNPIVATLGTLSAWGGLALYLTDGSTVAGLPDSFRKFGSMSLGPFPVQLLHFALVIVVAWFVLNRMPLGKQILAVGGNARAAHLMGVSVAKTRFGLYVATGVTAALAGILLSARLNAAPPTLGLAMEVTVLITVLLGGVAFEGGSGRIGTVVAGVLVIGALRNGLVLIGVSQFIQTILIGCTLVFAVALDRTFQRVITSSWQALGARAEQSTGGVKGVTAEGLTPAHKGVQRE